MGKLVIPVLGNIHTNFGQSAIFLFSVRSPYETNKRTDGRTDGGIVMRPTRTAA